MRILCLPHLLLLSVVSLYGVRGQFSVIIIPPGNTTVCRGNDVNISCGYLSATALPVTWIINGTSFTQQEIVNSSLYQLNNPTSPLTTSLTVFSINGTTTFQCVVLSTPNITSTRGTVTMTSGKADVDDGIKLSQYANLPRDNKKVPSLHNAMMIYDDNEDEPYKLRNDTSHDMSITVTPYTVVDIPDHKDSNSTFQPSHLPNDEMEPPNPSTADGNLAPQKGETDSQQQHSVEYAVVDRSKKKSRKEGKQQKADPHEDTDNGVQHVTVPTTTVPSDEAVKSKNHPSLHYAELEALPPSTDTYIVSDEPPTIYAQVA